MATSHMPDSGLLDTRHRKGPIDFLVYCLFAIRSIPQTVLIKMRFGTQGVPPNEIAHLFTKKNNFSEGCKPKNRT